MFDGRDAHDETAVVRALEHSVPTIEHGCRLERAQERSGDLDAPAFLGYPHAAGCLDALCGQ